MSFPLSLPMRQKTSPAWRQATEIAHRIRLLNVDALVTDVAVARNFKSTGLESADELFEAVNREMALLAVLVREFQSRSMNSEEIRKRERRMLGEVFMDLLESGPEK